MIAFLKGEVAGIYEDRIVLENGGIGYNIFMPASSLDMIRGLSEELKVYTYLSVREDAMWLYGFLTKDDLDFFKLLIQVGGIGPKGALSVLSVMRVNDLKLAILSGDAKTIAKAPGIGPKTAQRVILDLKDKVSFAEAFDESGTEENGTGMIGQDVLSQAVEALCALGYSATDAHRACRAVSAGEDDDVETVLKEALKHLI